MKIRKIISIFLMLCAAVCIAVAGAGLGGCKKDKPKTYVLSYESGADDAEGVAPEAVSYAEGEKITLAAADTFTRSGYTFEKWSYGGSTYAAGEEFAMPASDVTFTALWKEEAPAPSEKDEPTLTELSGKFYGAENWVFMTNNGGAATDAGEVPYTLNDGSIKFHRLNQAVEAGDFTNSTVSFMLKGTNDWSIWFNSSSKDNNDNYSYRLAYANGGLRLALSSAPDLAAAVVADSSYEKAEWNRIDIVFETKDKTCKIKLYINGERASLVAGDNVSGVTVSENVLTHAQPAMFKTGNYIVVKVWEAHNVLQLKPVAKKDVKDVPVVACIGASITQGAGLPDEYADSYPAQLQQKLGGGYNVLNFGNSGKTVTLTPKDGEPWLEQYQWEGVRSTVPDYAIFNIGTNDSKEANLTGSTLEERKAAFKTAFEHLLDEVVSVNTEMKIYICTVPYAYSNVWGINNKNIDEIIAPVQREVAKENGYTLIDIYEYSKNKSLLFRDGVHPHKNGFTMFTEIINKIMKDGELTSDYLAEIDAKYNDKVTNFTAAITTENGKLVLGVSGDTTLAATAQIKIAVGDDNGYKYFPAAIADGKFAASIDLTGFDYGSRWYNVQVYVYDETYYPEENTFFHLMLLDETDHTKEQVITQGETKLTVKSWDSSWGATFSFAVEAYFEISAEAAIAGVDGKIILTVSGVSSVSDLTLSIDDDNGGIFSKAITVTDNKFTVTYDLDEVAASGHYYYVNLVYNGTNFKVLLENATDGDGTPLQADDVFDGEHRIITIKTWNGYLAFYASNQADKADKPEGIFELDEKFYSAKNWEYMTNNNGAVDDGGDIVYSLDDGSVKFHRENQAINIGNISKASFMLRATDEWNIWFNSSSKDNNASSTGYRLEYAAGEIRITVHNGSTDITAAKAPSSAYEKWRWNRFDIEFAVENGVCKIKLYINEERVQLVAAGTFEGIEVADNYVYHTRHENFGGNYICVKVWDAHKFVQIKPVSAKDTEDVKIIAAIGASITAGANADNFYTESYPAQLQNLLGGSYNVINFGNSGKTVRPDPEDGEAWLKQDQWKGVQAIKPDVIIVNIGTNDSKPANFLGRDGFKKAYIDFINTIKAVNPDMEIYICTVPCAYSNSYGISNENIRDTIAPVQREVAQEFGYHLVDLYKISQNKSLIFDDGIHPHSLGYGMFAEIIEKMLTEGDGAITEEYLASIDAKYNDKLTNFHAEIAIDGDKINLVVSGDTTLENAGIKIKIGDGTENYYDAVISGGKFTATINLAQLESAYYNIRVYVYDEVYYPVENSFYHLMLLADTDGYTAGQIFRSDSKQVKLASWNSGWGATLSISSISDYHFIELTGATLAEADGKINLTLSGRTGDDNLRLYIGNAEDNESFYHDIAVSGGEFTVTYDLATLAPDGGWYNVRIYFADNSYFTVTYTAVKKADGAALTTSDAFKASGIKISIKTWGSENPLSLAVEAYDDSYSIVADEVKMEAGKLVFNGTAQNVTELIVALVNNADEVYGNGTDGKVEMGADGKFTVEIELSKLTANAGNWYYLRTKANGAEGWSYVDYAKTADKFIFGERVYRWEYANNGIAVAYSEYKGPTVTLDGATVEQSGNSVMLNISGSLTEISDLYDKTLLYIGNDAGNESNYHEVTKNGDAFTASFDLATLSFGSGMQIRFYHSRTDGGAKWGWYTLKFEEVTCGGEALAEGKSFELDGKKITFTTSASWKPVEVKVEDTTFEWAVNDVKFENGSLLVGGITSNVTSLEVTLKEKTQTFKETANIQPDGSYAVGFDLTALTKTGEWYKLYVSVNGGNEVQVEYYEGFDTTVKYVYGKYSYKFTTEWSNTKFALVMSNRSYNYGITSATISEVDGKATLTLEGTIDGDIAAADIELLLDKTSEVKEKLNVQNTATEAGKFSFSYDVSGLLLSTKTTQTKEEGYFMRLVVYGVNVNISSEKVKEKLFEPVVIGDYTYYFYRNSLTAYNTLGIVRIENSLLNT